MNKKLIISCALTIVVIVLAYVPVSGTSVRENIDTTSDYYSWEQWCHKKTLLGFTTKEKVGEFKLTGENITPNSTLETSICN